MAVNSLIPAVWSASILRNFEKSSVFAGLLSRTYAGEIKNQGDTVKVPKIGPVAVRPYVKGTPITYDGIDGSTFDIVVDRADYWALKTEDIEKVQAAPDFLDAATKNAAYALRDTVDSYTAGILDTGAGVVLGETAPIPAEDFLHLLALMGQKLTENNIPLAGRWCVLPPALSSGLMEKLAQLQTDNRGIISDGFIGRAYGFDLYVSNNTPADGDGNFSVLAGTADSGTHILQITETESIRDPQQFGDLVRGLAVYTSKVLLNGALVKAVVEPPTETIV